jgi:hypothetical protein
MWHRRRLTLRTSTGYGDYAEGIAQSRLIQ